MHKFSSRPFSFMFPIWGAQYRGYFLDRCLPSLLAPNNFPLLRAEDGHQLLIATTAEDRHAIERSTIADRISTFVRLAWIHIDSPEKAEDPFAQYTINIRHMGSALRKLVEAAFEYKSYGCSLLPDVIVSDGMVRSLLRSAQTGHHLVLCSSLRQVEEAVLQELTTRKMYPAREALTIPPRLAAGLAIRHMHPEIFRFDESGPNRESNPPFRFWRIPGGIILHTFFAVPLLMDFSVVGPNHMDCLDTGAFENVYIGANFSHCGGLHIIDDSDELMILSLAPRNVNWSPPVPKSKVGPRTEQEQIVSIRDSIAPYTDNGHDTVKMRLFRVAFRWHISDLDDLWKKDEEIIERIIDAAALGAVNSMSLEEPHDLFAGRIRHRRFFDLAAATHKLLGNVRSVAYSFLKIGSYAWRSLKRVVPP